MLRSAVVKNPVCEKWSNGEIVARLQREKRVKSRSFITACVHHAWCLGTGTFSARARSLTFLRFQVGSAEFGSNSIVHLTKVDSRKALRVVADFQLPSDTV